MNTTITIEKLVDTIIDHYQIVYSLIDHIQDLAASNNNLGKRISPLHTDLDPFDLLEDVPLLEEMLTKFFKNTEIKSDAKVLSEILKLDASHTKVCEVFHHDMADYNIDMGDEMSDMFMPLIHDKIKEYVDVALTTESKAKRLSVLDIYKQYNEAA